MIKEIIELVKKQTNKQIKEEIDTTLALHNTATVFGRAIKHTTWREFSFYHVWIEEEQDFVVLVFMGDMLVGKGENG